MKEGCGHGPLVGPICWLGHQLAGRASGESRLCGLPQKFAAFGLVGGDGLEPPTLSV